MNKSTFRLFFIVFFFSLFNKGSEIIAQTTTQTFNYTGANQTFVVPPCVNSITIQAWGGAGGGGGWDTYTGSDGGGGAYSTSVLTVTPGTSLTIIVGGGGGPGGACQAGAGSGTAGFGYGNGGAGGDPGTSGCSGPGGGGGGGTGVMNGATLLLVAGGGGGGGGGGNYGSGGAGGGGGVDGVASTSATGGLDGVSGSTVGAIGHNAGGSDGAGGGGGGGGLEGGGGGNTPNTDNGGAGGGGGTSQGTTINNGSGTTPGNSGTIAGICSTCSKGGTGAPGGGGTATAGGNGVLVISYNNPPPITGSIASSPGLCGTSTATVTPTGGTAGYTYTWSPIGGNAASSTSLTNGTYTVNMTDANGCTGSANTTIAVPGALSLTALTSSITCNGLSNGSATATVSGGTGPTYTVGIIAPPQGGITTSVEVLNNLPAGSYTIGAQDGAGCTTIFPITITQPNALTVATTQTNVTCFGGTNGSVLATAAGGITPYTYNWSPAGGTTVTASNLSAQNYTVTVTDANLCSITSTLTITQPTLALAADVTSTNILCNGLSNGSATVAAGGGTPGYTYSWSPAGGTTTTASNLPPQNYTVTVTDANLCTTTATTSITQPPALTLTAVTTSVTCFGLSNGSATATATGGTGPTYTVGVIAPPQGGITTGVEIVSGLAAGSYTIGVQDANGCQDIFLITIAQPATAVSATTTQTNVTCFGLATGSATALPVGGTPGYTYTWSPIGGNAVTATNLTAQPYMVTVADANLCTTVATLTITQPPLFAASITSFTNESCFGGNNGAATATQTGGTGPFTYSWTPTGGTTDTASNLTAQVYTLTVTDANLCPATTTVNITQPPLLVVSYFATNATCNGLSTGCATVVATGGTGPTFTLGISSNPPQINVGPPVAVFCGLPAGSYSLVAQDANGCPSAVFICPITQPPALTLTATGTEVTCNGLSNGSATATVTGGTASYTIGVNSVPPQLSPTTETFAATGLPAGTYTFGVQDANNCQDTVSITITQPAVLTASISASHNDSCFGNSNGNAAAAAAGGTPVYSYSWTPIGGIKDTASNLPAGTYTATITDSKGCVVTTFTTITQPPVLTVASTPTTICISNMATLTATAMGGNTVLPYIYSIAGAISNTTTVNPTTTTTYTLGVIDMKGCIATNTVTVFVRNSLSFLAVNPNDSICKGFSAHIGATVVGGDSMLTYNWVPSITPPNQQNPIVFPVATTVYTITVSDGCGTPPIDTVITVFIYPLPNMTFTADKTQGCYPLTVNFTGTSQIPVSDIQSYTWSLGAGTSTIANPTITYGHAGVYSIEVTTISDDGCVSRDSVLDMITVYNHPVANFYYNPNPVTILNPQVDFTSTSTAPYNSIKSLFWSTFGDNLDSTNITSNPIHIYQDTGTFCVTLIATNQLGCKDTIQQCVVVKPYFTLYVPNTFSPNGDGINDQFLPVGEYIETFDMQIFDRWGSIVYHSTNIDSGWNGSKGGAVAKEDVYVVLISATDTQNKPHSYHGTVTLIK